ncbi:dual specificity protein phosphatase 3 [Aspergillus taichungensis]|uniref:Dual specificity protein phosphatase 3 n=1 Tax=Aspergillus taichungensis TaxID=482145 RepID=A0A2J5HKK8_9EURO|nr:dual specificity protein phosphatase 3 [Aspergillus taichungensis]
MAFLPRCSEVPMSQQPDSQYVRTHEYTPGSAPVPQPSFSIEIYEQTVAQMEPISPATHYYQEGEFVPPGFFDNVSREIFVLPRNSNDWQYNMRREFQAVLPYLYLGPWGCLRDRNKLQAEGITLLLGVRDKRLANARLYSGDMAAADLAIEADTIDIKDGQELISELPRIIRRINQHISTPSVARFGPVPDKKVLLFCETGNGLSAFVAIAYLMAMFNLDLAHALQAVHIQRFCIDTDEAMRPLLVSFESILEAKRDVGKATRSNFASPSLAPPSTVAKKRSFADRDDVEEVEGGMDLDLEEDSVPDRRPMAPFQDRAE